jgi:hypothetical protein
VSSTSEIQAALEKFYQKEQDDRRVAVIEFGLSGAGRRRGQEVWMLRLVPPSEVGMTRTSAVGLLVGGIVVGMVAMWALTGTKGDGCRAGANVVTLEIKDNQIANPAEGCVYIGGSLTWYARGQAGDRVQLNFDKTSNPSSGAPFQKAPGPACSMAQYCIDILDPSGGREVTGPADKVPPDKEQVWSYTIVWYRDGIVIDRLDPKIRIRNPP